MARGGFGSRVVVSKNTLAGADAKTRDLVATIIGKTAYDTAGTIRRNIKTINLWDTGALHGSWDATQVGPMTWRVSTDKEYATYWEFGHYNIFTRSQQPPRPTVRPAAMECYAKMQAAFRQLLPRLFGGI